MATTYWDYIRVEDLLKLQGGVEDDESQITDHEVLFIAVHQVFELWFKLALRELTSVRNLFALSPVPETAMAGAAGSLDRMTRIFRQAASHFEIMESLNTRDYLDFRDKLFPASGFQSAQLREFEILLGLQDKDRIGLGAAGKYMDALRDPGGSTSPALARVERRKADTPTVLKAVGDWLFRTPIRGSQPGQPQDTQIVDGFLTDYLAALTKAVEETRDIALAANTGFDPVAMTERYAAEIEQARRFFFPESARLRRIRAAVLFIESYRDLPLLSWPRKLLAGLVEFEQAVVVFRQRHARMVERVIGRRVGTGGSSGVDYLDQSALSYRVFSDLWTVRTFQIRAALLPPLEETKLYDFNATFGD
jgi:tryptophan 2,3-dioxygenase